MILKQGHTHYSLCPDIPQGLKHQTTNNRLCAGNGTRQSPGSLDSLQAQVSMTGELDSWLKRREIQQNGQGSDFDTQVYHSNDTKVSHCSTKQPKNQPPVFIDKSTRQVNFPHRRETLAPRKTPWNNREQLPGVEKPGMTWYAVWGVVKDKLLDLLMIGAFRSDNRHYVNLSCKLLKSLDNSVFDSPKGMVWRG